MLNKPKFMTPSTNTQDCVIDLSTSAQLFSCIVDGNEPVYAWRIKIFTLAKNILVYDTGRQDISSSPFYPINNKNQYVLFTKNLKDYPNQATIIQDEHGKDINFRNSDDAYYWIIELYNKTDSEASTELYDGSISYIPTVKSCEEVFYANTVPEISVQYTVDDTEYHTVNNNSTIDSSRVYFKATYKQDEDVPVKKFGWRITNTENGQLIMDTISKNQIYGIADNITCFYDGFLNNTSYSIEVYVETQNGYKYITPVPIVFNVFYSTAFFSNDYKVEFLENEAAILNDWSESKVFEGEIVNGDNSDIGWKKSYPVPDSSQQSIIIGRDASVGFNYSANSSLDITEDAYIAMSFQLYDDSATTIFEASGYDRDGNLTLRTLRYDNGIFKYTVGTTSGYHEAEFVPVYTPCAEVWFVVKMPPYDKSGEQDSFIIEEYHVTGGKYPSPSTYPFGSLYPSFGEWKKVN